MGNFPALIIIDSGDLEIEPSREFIDNILYRYHTDNPKAYSIGIKYDGWDFGWDDGRPKMELQPGLTKKDGTKTNILQVKDWNYDEKNTIVTYAVIWKNGHWFEKYPMNDQSYPNNDLWREVFYQRFIHVLQNDDWVVFITYHI